MIDLNTNTPTSATATKSMQERHHNQVWTNSTLHTTTAMSLHVPRESQDSRDACGRITWQSCEAASHLVLNRRTTKWQASMKFILRQ